MPIRLYPDPVLRKTAEKVTKFGGRTQCLINRMQKAIRETRAIGLAAPQVGCSQQIIIVEGRVMINPATIELGEYFSGVEYCLSLPGIAVKVNRPFEVRGTYQDRQGHAEGFVFTDKKARCFLHEMDHLYGILIIDFIGKKNE